MNKRSKSLLLACLVPVLILLGMTAIPLYTIFNGEEITLQTVPVDPSDVFRGDYVSLRYEAEEVPVKLLEKAVLDKSKNDYGFRVYVSLKEKDGVYTPAKVTLEKPDTGIYLKGKMGYIGTKWDPFTQKESIDNVAFVEYSLDKYFVEDNTGLKWEQASSKGEILATVKIFKGYAYLTEIKIKD
jgi:uncharacterized membrane-anchored protein